jgi:prefoldin subunit 5
METEVRINGKEIMQKLTKLQADMHYIREYIEDITLTVDDLNSIKEAKKDLKEGKTRRL